MLLLSVHEPFSFAVMGSASTHQCKKTQTRPKAQPTLRSVDGSGKLKQGVWETMAGLLPLARRLQERERLS